jgi:steroid delta-isomerase-like uncharacterized protein
MEEARFDRRSLLRSATLGAGALVAGSLWKSGHVRAETARDRQANAAVARQFYQVLNTGDLSLLKETLAPNWVAHPLNPGQGPGRDGFGPVVRAFRTSFPDLRFTIEDLIVAREKVVVRSTARGTHQGTFLGVPPTGRPVEFRATDIHRFAHRLIVDTWHLEDFYSFLVEVKAFPAHKAASDREMSAVTRRRRLSGG